MIPQYATCTCLGILMEGDLPKVVASNQELKCLPEEIRNKTELLSLPVKIAALLSSQIDFAKQKLCLIKQQDLSHHAVYKIEMIKNRALVDLVSCPNPLFLPPLAKKPGTVIFSVPKHVTCLDVSLRTLDVYKEPEFHGFIHLNEEYYHARLLKMQDSLPRDSLKKLGHIKSLTKLHSAPLFRQLEREQKRDVEHGILAQIELHESEVEIERRFNQLKSRLSLQIF